MNTKILIGVVVTIVIVAAIYFFIGPCRGDKVPVEPVDTICKDKAPELHEVKVKLVEGIWKVIYLKDGESAELHACPGDKIVWEAENTDIYIQFYEESLFGSYKKMGLFKRMEESQAQAKNKTMVKISLPKLKLELQVLPEAKRGRYYYSIFCTGEPAGYAEQDSPPVIIID